MARDLRKGPVTNGTPERRGAGTDQGRVPSAFELTGSLDDPLGTPLGYAYAFAHQKDVIRNLIVGRNVKAVCEIGGGRSPLFSLDEVSELGVEYTVLDVSAKELALASPRYAKVIGDICNVGTEDGHSGSYDLMFSQMLAEHVSSGEAMHRNIYGLLRPGGVAFHFFPTLFSPAFLANRLLPERLAEWVLTVVHRGHEKHEKFPAKYSWCYGPSQQSVQRFRALGYTVLDYRAFYGTAYLRFFPGIRRLEEGFHRVAARRRSRLFTSYAWLILLRPAAEVGNGGSR